jgi:hypothetical protein
MTTPPPQNPDAPDAPDAERAAEDEAPAATGALADLRAVDAINRPAEVEAALSADEIAQLEAWFGRPSMTELVEKGEVRLDMWGRPIDPDAERKRMEARERATEAVDPRMVERLERHTPAGDRLLQFRASLEVRIDPSGFERPLMTLNRPDILEVERPEDLADAMREATPQALLRDLHRPEDEFSIEYVRPEPVESDADPFGEARRAIAAGYKYAPEMRLMMQARDALRPLREAKASVWSEIRTPTRTVDETAEATETVGAPAESKE